VGGQNAHEGRSAPAEKKKKKKEEQTEEEQCSEGTFSQMSGRKKRKKYSSEMEKSHLNSKRKRSHRRGD